MIYVSRNEYIHATIILSSNPCSFKSQYKSTPNSLLTLNLQSPSVAHGFSTAESQTQADPLTLGGEERLEDQIPFFGRDAATGVRNLQCPAIFSRGAAG